MQTSGQTTATYHERIYRLHESGMPMADLVKKFGRKKESIETIIADKKKSTRFFDWNAMGDPFINGRVGDY